MRTSVKQAPKLVRERDVEMPDTDEAKTPMRRAWRQADVAATNKQYKQAAELFAKAWNLWHPNNGRVLTAAGHFARLAGDAPGAQLLFARALEDLEQQYDTTGKVELPSGFTNIQAVAWHPKEQLLAVADGNEIVLIDAITGRERLRLQGHTDNVASVVFSSDCKNLATGSEDDTVWRVADGSLIRRLHGHADWVTSVTYSPDGMSLASGSSDKTVRLWRVADGTLIRELPGIAAVIEELRPYMLGWTNYFYLQERTSLCRKEHRCFENWTIGFVTACECSISSNGRTAPTPIANSGPGDFPTRLRRRSRAISGAGGATRTWRSVGLYFQAISTASVYRDLLRNLNSSNRPVRIRMPGGVRGVWRGLRHPYPDNQTIAEPRRASTDVLATGWGALPRSHF